MQVQVNTDKNIEGGERLTLFVKTALDARLRRFGAQITRVEAHLSDESSQKSHGNDKKCVLEARPVGKPAAAVSHVAATLDQAIHGAAEKLERLLDGTLGQVSHPKAESAPDLA
jgi:ribosome-associated translation inhibitor RaiA